MSEPLDWSLLSGGLPVTVTALGTVAAGFLLVRRGQSRWPRIVVSVLAGAALLALVAVWCVDHLWRPFPDHLPWPVTVWLGVGVSAIGLCTVNWWRARWWRRVVAVAAAAIVVLTCAVQVNAHYGQYPAVRNALGVPPRNMIRLDRTPSPAPTTSLQAPATSQVAEVNIAGTISGFKARPAWIYLPPAYRTSSQHPLPVVVLLAGQPGNPRDWFDGGRVDQILDEFARRHHGRAPVVVIPDDLGAPLANPLCLDSRLGNVETYLARDVPAWIRQNLQVDRDPAHWAIAGFSHGGTCSLQLSVRYPQLFPTFIDITGQDEPTLGDRRGTVAAAFGGDDAAFRRVNPGDILVANRFPGTVAVLVVGSADATYKRQQEKVRAACAAAGMKVTWFELPGGHSWAVWAPGFARGLDHIADRIGLG
jgi:S-formylglutathione hydrolase FrmB